MKRLGLQNPRLFALAQQRKNIEYMLAEQTQSTFQCDGVYRRTGRSTIEMVEILEHLKSGWSVLVCSHPLDNLAQFKCFQSNFRKFSDLLNPGSFDKVKFAYGEAQKRGVTADVVFQIRDGRDNLPAWVWNLTDEEWDMCPTTSIKEVCRKDNWLLREAEFSIQFDGISQESYAVELAEFNKYVDSRRTALHIKKEG